MAFALPPADLVAWSCSTNECPRGEGIETFPLVLSSSPVYLVAWSCSTNYNLPTIIALPHLRPRRHPECIAIAQDTYDTAFHMQNHFVTHLTLLLAMAGEFVQKSEAKEVERWLASVGLASVSIEDIQTHNQGLLKQLNEHMQQVRAEDDRRRALVASNRNKEGGKRSSVNICQTVVPLMGAKDEGTVKAMVQQAVEAHQNLGTKYEDPDFAPYSAKGHSVWKRLTELYDTPVLYKDIPKAGHSPYPCPFMYPCPHLYRYPYMYLRLYTRAPPLNPAPAPAPTPVPCP